MALDPWHGDRRARLRDFPSRHVPSLGAYAPGPSLRTRPTTAQPWLDGPTGELCAKWCSGGRRDRHSEHIEADDQVRCRTPAGSALRPSSQAARPVIEAEWRTGSKSNAVSSRLISK